MIPFPTSKGPPSLICHLCGKPYGTKSLSLHIPKCVEKWEKEQEVLPSHLRLPPPNGPHMPPPSDPRNRERLDQYNDEAYQIFSSSLPACPTCGRRFAPEPLRRHLDSCAPAELEDKKSPKAKGFQEPVGIVCHICGRKFGTHSIRLHYPECAKKWSKRMKKLPSCVRRDAPSLSEEHVPDPGAVGEKLKVFNDFAFRLWQDSLPKCPFCLRHMEIETLEAHWPKCRKNEENVDLWGIMSIPTLYSELTHPAVPSQTLSASSQSSMSEKPIRSGDDSSKEGSKTQSQPVEHVDADSFHESLVPCSICGRKFLPSRLDRHEAICRKHPSKGAPIDAKGSPKSSGFSGSLGSSGSPTSSGKTPLSSPSRKVQTMKPSTASHPEPPKPRERTPAGNPSTGLVPCKFCQRTFSKDRVEKHEAVCLQRKTGGVSTSPNPSPKKIPKETAKATSKPIPKREPEATFCSQCGNKFPESAKFCPQCGTKR